MNTNEPPARLSELLLIGIKHTAPDNPSQHSELMVSLGGFDTTLIIDKKATWGDVVELLECLIVAIPTRSTLSEPVGLPRDGAS